MTRENKNYGEQPWISKEDLQDIAKIGGDILKRTVSSGIDVIKDVTDTLPKDASQLISKSREEVLKGLTKEFAQNLVALAVDRMFAAVREHRLDISIKVRKAGDPENPPSGESPTAESADKRHQTSARKHHPSRHHP
ncbi:MAG: hypothetical protein RIR26_2755 [Pseudomonadota bacterium]|jgi:hypothetical protein